ncbi:hypothetical protein [Agromyces salentinus]|nr:hypothetical protein [Agromyces salentinus]
MTSRWARVARGGVIAAFATFVAALSHTLGGGSAPGALAVGLSFAFSALLCIAVVGARLSAVRTVIAVGVTQFALHALYSVQGASAAPAVRGAGHHHLIELPPVAASAAPFAYDASMFATHLAAVVVTVVAIRRGDAALHAALRAMVLAVGAVIRGAPVLDVEAPARLMPSRSSSRFAEPRALAGLLHLSTMRHRGPPQVVAVV